MTNPTGTPVWFELTTADPDAAQRFYAAVLGWQTVASPHPDHGGYRIAHAGDDAVAGIIPPQHDEHPLGWGVYFASTDIDADARRIVDAGGTVHIGPMDIPDVGRFLVASDPQGVEFSLMAEGGDPSRAFIAGGEAASGHGCWLELATPDPDGAFAFYGTLFGWEKAGAMAMPADMGDYSFIGDGAGGAGCTEPSGPTGPGAIMSSTATHAQPRWNWYVTVPDIDAAVDAVKANGGAILQEPQEIPGGDYAANLTDPAGHLLGIVGRRMV